MSKSLLSVVLVSGLVLGGAGGGCEGGGQAAKEAKPPSAGTAEPAVAAAEGRETAPSRAAAREARSRRGPDARSGTARWAGGGTIFDPLDLPTPTTVRGASGAPGPDYWQQRADYEIEATLDVATNVLTGRETITYTNNSPDTLPYVWLHLEQNLFRSDSLGSLTTPPRTRFANRDEFEGGFDVQHVRIARVGGGSLGPADDEPNPDGVDVPFHVYDTLAKIDLPAPIPARGGKLVLQVAWSFTVPKYGADRMGIRDGDDGAVYELAQWFPAIAKYDDVSGWNTIPYYGQGEFYTDFGSYKVRLTLPREHMAVCTGVLVNEAEVLTETQRERLARARQSAETVIIRGPDEVRDPASRPAGEGGGAGGLTWEFHADDVRTVAWASSAAFIWDAAWLGGTGPDGKGTLVQSVYPGEAMEHWPKSTAMLRAAIEGYSQRWFSYPYPAAINVNGVAGGMEYPMIIFCGGRNSEDGLWGVTTHEIGHNWFPMIVSNDERRHAWMDEGFNSFINYYSWQDYRGTSEGRRGHARSFVGFMKLPDQQPMATFADRVMPGRLGQLQYEKTAVGLVMLREHILGPERFDAAFREYVRRWAFKSPQPADFFRSMEDAAGMDLAWFWRGWFLGTGTLDQAVEDVDMAEDGKIARITLSNLGELVMPVDLRLTLEDGAVVERTLPAEVWRYASRWETQVPTGGKAVTKVEVDPDGGYPDVEPKNNVWKAPEPAPASTPPAAEEHQE